MCICVCVCVCVRVCVCVCISDIYCVNFITYMLFIYVIVSIGVLRCLYSALKQVLLGYRAVEEQLLLLLLLLNTSKFPIEAELVGEEEVIACGAGVVQDSVGHPLVLILRHKLEPKHVDPEILHTQK